MSVLATSPAPRTLGEALALRPDLLAGQRALDAALASEPSLDPVVRERCRLRVAQLVGGTGAAAAPVDPDDVAVEFVEQMVLDVHGVSDALVARLAAVLSPRAMVTLAQATAVWEGRCRLARALQVTPEI
jgi:alkylhydroperoxidase family enzyme